jgi:hypothetical protein
VPEEGREAAALMSRSQTSTKGVPMIVRLAILAAVAALPLSLAACGDNGLSSDDQDQITKAIEFATTSGDPKACTEAQTQSFTEQTSGGTGEAAVKECEQNAEPPTADSVEVSNFDGDSDSATADVAFKGEFFDGQTVQVDLVKEGDQWKLDKAVGFKDFDRDAFITAFPKSLATTGAPPAAIDCVGKNLQDLSDQQIEDLFLDSDPKLQQQVFNPCFRGE